MRVRDEFSGETRVLREPFRVVASAAAVEPARE